MRILTITALGLIVALLGGCAAMMADKAKANPYTLEIINEAPELSSDEIYNAARLWIAETFVSGKEVTQLEDSEMGVVVGRGITQVEIGWLTYVDTFFKIRVDSKDGRYRLTFSDVSVDFGTAGKRPIATNENVSDNVTEEFNSIAADFHQYITTARDDASW